MRAVGRVGGNGNSVTVGSAPDGADGLILAELVRQHTAKSDAGVVVYVARDDAQAASMTGNLQFFAPDLTLIDFPAWDCLPYDRVSPKPGIVSRRMSALADLVTRESGNSTAPAVVVTTINAALQRVPPKVVTGSWSLAAGQVLNLDELADYLTLHGFHRTGTVREAGEFAVRGGLVDVFPPGADRPVRLDLFGDTLDSIRAFDPETQRTTEQIARFDLVPASEVPLDPDAIKRFRAAYRSTFGAVGGEDPLYESISAGRKFPGMEHLLPLFYADLDTLFDYVPTDSLLVFDHLVDDARRDRLSLIQDYHEARQQSPADLQSPASSSVYRALAPDRLYLTEEEWGQLLSSFRVRVVSPFSQPDQEHFIDAGARRGRNFSPERTAGDVNVFDSVVDHIQALQGRNKRIAIACWTKGSSERLAKLLNEHGSFSLHRVERWLDAQALKPGIVALVVVQLEHGFEYGDWAVIAEQDILGDRLILRKPRRAKASDLITSAASLNVGDLVVHLDHGIGRYEGLQTISVSGAPHDCLLLIYHGGDKLYLPVENIELISRYGSDESEAQLDRLGGSGWQTRKARLKARIRELAGELIKIAADRELKSAPNFAQPDGLYEEFCARFPYDETDDQQHAINDVFGDLGRGRPADRLICGDVGFGKTEVALRAAFAVAMAGGQVAVVTPTTLLCRQHFKTFTERFAGWPVKVRQLSRLQTSKDNGEVRAGLESGTVDIVIGTHALLSQSIRFQNLSLLIVDEEQHFGVVHKERLKKLKSNVHVITLTATPIPRTLQLAMSGVRDMSLIATPPVDRLAVRTYVTPFDQLILREALMREHFRGGQSFFVCPRIADIPEISEFLRDNVPEVRFCIAHGQMPAAELDAVMNAFYDGQYDILLSTSIVESGLDIPRANTLIVHRADMFGLAQFYQLRGRIGRSKQRAYAYFTISPAGALTANAEKRLEVIQSLDSLGAGFTLASHDLDIRGAGNLLGDEQSGHIREVGVELYQSMLEEAVATQRGTADDTGEERWSPQINIGTSVLIPEGFVPDLDVRLELYRRLSTAATESDVDAFAAELADRFGALPDDVEHLLDVVSIKVLCRRAGVDKVDAGPKGVTLSFRNNEFANPAGLITFISGRSDVKLRPDHTLVVKANWPTPEMRLQGVRKLVGEIAAIATAESVAA